MLYTCLDPALVNFCFDKTFFVKHSPFEEKCNISRKGRLFNFAAAAYQYH